MENIKNKIDDLMRQEKYDDALASINAYLAENNNSDSITDICYNTYKGNALVKISLYKLG